MKLRYTPKALRQLDAVMTYIDERNPDGARRVKERIHTMIALLADHPMAGQATNRPGQRRVVVSPYPYAVFYRVEETEVIVQRIRHTARQSQA